MKLRFLSFLLFFAGLTVFSQNAPLQPNKVKSIKQTKEGILITAAAGQMKLIAYSPSAVRVRYSTKAFEPDFSYSVVQSPEGSFKSLKDGKDSCIVTTDSLKIIIYKGNLRLAFYDSHDRLLSEDYKPFSYTTSGTEITCNRKLFSNEHFLGLGEKTGKLDKRGGYFVNWNSDMPGYDGSTDPLYQSIPFFIGIHEPVVYGIFLDNTAKTKFDFAASTDDQFSWFSVPEGEMNYYFIGGGSVARVIENYTWLTGRMPLPPLWSLGYQQCRWGYYPESEVMSLAQKFRDKKLPCDVIYLDIDYMDHYKIFTWSPDKFPDPASMLGKLKSMGFHVVTIVDPGIKVENGYFAYEDGISKDLFIRYPDGTRYVGNVWPGRCHFPDFTKPETRSWWGSSFSHLTGPGVEGFWNDMNEPAVWGQDIPNLVRVSMEGNGATMSRAHNIYGFQMARATYEGTKKLMNGKRPFILTRAGFSGVQRYSAVWTGDNVASDDHMIISARMVSGMGLSGIAFAGPDIGGFIDSPSRELFIRWMSQGCYTPLFRNHTAVNTRDQEPWAFGEDIEAMSKKVLEQRYQLLPYIYSMFYTATQTGLPVARSLAIEHPFDEQNYGWDYQNQYLFGENILLVPVNSTHYSVKAYLPGGWWYRMSTDELYKTQGPVLVDAPLGDLPVFVKGSGIIPMQSVIQNTSEQPSSEMILHIYNGLYKNRFQYYEDDGTTYEYENGKFYKRVISYDPDNREIILLKPEGSYVSKFTSVRIVLHGFSDIASIRINGQRAELKKESDKTFSTVFPLYQADIVIVY